MFASSALTQVRSKMLVFTILVMILSTEMTVGNPFDKGIANDRPIIAVLAQSLPPYTTNHTYIAASYVKYLESSGARVVPIPHYLDMSEVDEIFSYVNGVLFPGGGIKWFSSPYYKNAKRFWDLAIAANNKGDYFPIWGTCLGFEALHVILANSDRVLSGSMADDLALPLDYTSNAKDSRIFKHMPTSLFNAIQTENLTYNHHSKGIAPETYQSNQVLRDFFNVLSTNQDENGKKFISSVEAYQYPIYGVQWHPEKNNFEHTPNEVIPHSANAVRVSQYMANFFVDEARKSFHKFPSTEMEEKYMIYKYNTIHTAVEGKVLKNFEQIYVFK